MTDVARERPSIHVGMVAGADASLYRWIEVGAEEEGLPTVAVASEERDAVAAAFVAAQSSRFGIGVGVGARQVVLHEAHMPRVQPVLSFDLGAEPGRACRLIGGNAARLVVRLPLRFADEIEPPPAPRAPAQVAAQADQAAHADIAALARTIARRIATAALAPAPPQPATGEWGEAEIKLIAGIVARRLRERGVS